MKRTKYYIEITNRDDWDILFFDNATELFKYFDSMELTDDTESIIAYDTEMDYIEIKQHD